MRAVLDFALGKLTFQEVLAELLRSPDLAASGGGADPLILTVTPGGHTVTLFGDGLFVDVGGRFSGTTDHFLLSDPGAPDVFVDITLPTATSLDELVETARGLPPGFNPGDLGPFNELLMPPDSPFPNLDMVGSPGRDTALGFGGNDVFNLNGGPDVVLLTPGNDRFDGGPGRDLVSGAFLDEPVVMDLTAGRATFGTNETELISVENATGTSGDDEILGNGRNNVLRGGSGDDVINGGRKGDNQLFGQQGDDSITGGREGDLINGGGGKDSIDGGGGEDTLIGNGGLDTIRGQGGNDTIKGGGGADLIDGGSGRDVLYGNAGNDTIDGGSGNDLLGGADGGDILAGGGGSDTLRGDAGMDVLRGESGDDVILGGGERDRLVGGAGDDTLTGDAGADTLVGGSGDDLLTGGGGADTFEFVRQAGGPAQTDRITDFRAGLDQLVIANVEEDQVTVSHDGGNTIVAFFDDRIILEGEILEKSDLGLTTDSDIL